jgi:hypothetical protein
MNELNIFLFLLTSLSVGEFAIQMQISELSQWVKETTGLQQPYRLSGLSNIWFWFRLFGKWFWVLSPLLLIIIGFFYFHKFVSSLIDCSYCTSFWLATAVNFFYFKLPLPEALLFAPIALVFVAILDRIHSS